MWEYVQSDELYHHGIKGQKWGVRRYQNPDGTLTAAGRRRLAKDTYNLEKMEIETKYGKAMAKAKNSADRVKAKGNYNMALRDAKVKYNNSISSIDAERTEKEAKSEADKARMKAEKKEQAKSFIKALSITAGTIGVAGILKKINDKRENREAQIEEERYEEDLKRSEKTFEKFLKTINGDSTPYSDVNKTSDEKIKVKSKGNDSSKEDKVTNEKSKEAKASDKAAKAIEKEMNKNLEKAEKMAEKDAAKRAAEYQKQKEKAEKEKRDAQLRREVIERAKEIEKESRNKSVSSISKPKAKTMSFIDTIFDTNSSYYDTSSYWNWTPDAWEDD